MRLIDLSQPVYHEAPNCPGHPKVSVEMALTHGETTTPDRWHMEMLTLASHTGSHLDAPLHKIAGGKSISDLPLETFVGPAYIVDMRNVHADFPIDDKILADTLGDDLPPHVIVLLATGWGQKRAFTDEWLYHPPYLTEEGAAWLVGQHVRGVGIDHYSIGGAQEPRNAFTHTVLLGAGLWILEELNFPDEAFTLPKPVTLWALPVNFKDFSGAFCRPVIAVP